ncbi:MAG TPA: hypothetical protein VHP58_03960 [Alphaproteobacteria bacterium]|nr:hypothetical protein [Alphaproteobacteria bacterium]
MMRYAYLMMAAALGASTATAADTLAPAVAAGVMPEFKRPELCILKLASGKEVPGPCEMDGAKKVRKATDDDLNKFLPPVPPLPPQGALPAGVLPGGSPTLPPALGNVPAGMPAGLPGGEPVGLPRIPAAQPIEVTPAQ